MKELQIRPREVRIWYQVDGTIKWRARLLKPSEIAMMGVVLQDGALRELSKQPSVVKQITRVKS